MRVITGIARGRKLETLDGFDVRPTTEKVKEAVFSSIQFDIEGRRILDLFAGSGQLGIEALSRGAQSTVFVDASPDSVSVVERNLKTTGFTEQATVLRKDYFSFLASNTDEFDIAFLDPPYREGVLEKAAQLTASKMSDYGIIICEHPTDVELPEDLGCGFTLKKKMKYGKIAVSIFRKAGR